MSKYVTELTQEWHSDGQPDQIMQEARARSALGGRGYLAADGSQS